MIMDHVIFFMIIIWVWVKYQCHICKIKMQFLKLKKTGNRLMMNVMITGAFFSIIYCSCCSRQCISRSFWLIRINKNSCIANSEDPDFYGYNIVPGQHTKKGTLGKIYGNKKFIIYKQLNGNLLLQRNHYLPMCCHWIDKKELKLENQHYTDILTHVQETKYSQLKCYVGKTTENGIWKCIVY